MIPPGQGSEHWTKSVRCLQRSSSCNRRGRRRERSGGIKRLGPLWLYGPPSAASSPSSSPCRPSPCFESSRSSSPSTSFTSASASSSRVSCCQHMLHIVGNSIVDSSVTTSIKPSFPIRDNLTMPEFLDITSLVLDLALINKLSEVRLKEQFALVFLEAHRLLHVVLDTRLDQAPTFVQGSGVQLGGNAVSFVACSQFPFAGVLVSAGGIVSPFVVCNSQ